MPLAKLLLFTFGNILKEIQCLKAELKRKEDLLADVKKKLSDSENILKSFGMSLDNQLKTRLESSTHGYIPNENQIVHPGSSSTMNTPTYEQQSSVENNVILLQ